MNEPTGVPVLVALAGVVGGGIVGWWLARWARHGKPTHSGVASSMPTPTPAAVERAPAERDLLPDPALDWLRRAHGALGIWINELDPDEEGPRAERLVDAERLSVAQIVAVDRRLEGARDREECGAERMEGGLLVFGGAHGIAAGVLLPGDADAGTDGAARVAQVESDVRRLLDGLRRKPQAVALAQARTREATFESAASVGLRLAYQIERMLGARGVRADVVVAVEEGAGARIVGVSGGADRRLLDSVLPEDSALARVARGEGEASGFAGDPLGGIVVDRRARLGESYLLPIWAAGHAVGAVLIWLAPGEALADAVRTEVSEALADAGPRLIRAAEAGRARQGGSADPLTGLPDGQGLVEAMGAGEGQGRPGALIMLDLDRFTMLNEALGTAAGDAALVHIAHVLRGQVRGDDVPVRIGGGRFAVWLPDAAEELGARVAERLRNKIHTAPWDWQGRSWPLAASLGVAVRSDVNVGSEAVVAQASAALAQAKRRGRNRVETAG